MALIDILAKADEGSRLLDSRVARALQMRVDLVDGEATVFCPSGARLPCPAFTTSVDAAAGAVPAGWQWGVNTEEREAMVWRRWPNGQREQFSATASRLPLALCAASLLARERAARPIRIKR